MWIVCWASWSVLLVTSFAPPPIARSVPRRFPHVLPPFKIDSAFSASTTILRLDISSSIVMAEEQPWRQYIPLAVSCFVILDILLGSPAANSVMGLMRPREDELSDDDFSLEEGTGQRRRRLQKSPGERIDSMAIAQAAIDKANATLELKRFLADRKTDYDKMEDIRKNMDQQMQEFDDKIREQQQRRTQE